MSIGYVRKEQTHESNTSGEKVLYTLSCPITNRIRYVGIGTKTRAYNYTRRSAHCKSWIKGLKLKGLSPITTIRLAGLTWQEACTQERIWIILLKPNGFLTNMTNGGEGTQGVKHSPERLAQITEWSRNQVRKPHTDETKIKLSRANTGKKLSEETKAKMTATRKGRVMGQEYREAIKRGWETRRANKAKESQCQ